MRPIALAIVAAIYVYGNVCEASPRKGRASDPMGTTFIISVDWDTKVVSADLRRNPANLKGADLEYSMQKAVYFGSAWGCQMKQRGRVQTTRSKITGILECSYEEGYAK